MPHECTTCGRTFDNGSKQMLSGCPDCGGNKFQFQPAGNSGGGSATETRSDDTGDTESETNISRDETESTARNQTESTAQTGIDEEFDDAEIADEVAAENRAQSDARSSPATADEIDEARRTNAETAAERFPPVDDEPSSSSHGRGTPQGPPTDSPPAEKTEQFDLSGAVGPDDGQPIAKEPSGSIEEPEPEPGPTDEDADLSALREELNDQFESIKITAPGQYELNLMELYERKEYIISLQEDGRYVIEMAEDYGVED